MSDHLRAKDNDFEITNFYGREFLINKNVLTPRPETEQMIDAVLDLCGIAYLPGVKPSPPLLDSHHLTILDVGTGSGCIAITLKKELPEAYVFASDISREAIEIAQKNATRQSTPITFIISHLLENVKTPSTISGTDNTFGATSVTVDVSDAVSDAVKGADNVSDSASDAAKGEDNASGSTSDATKSEIGFKPDLIVANLPYVDKNWPWLDKKSLESDPDIALYANDGGLALIKELISTSYSPYLILESDPSQHEKIIKYAMGKYRLIKKMGYVLVFDQSIPGRK